MSTIQEVEAWLALSHRRCVQADVNTEVQKILAERDTSTLTTPDPDALK